MIHLRALALVMLFVCSRNNCPDFRSDIYLRASILRMRGGSNGPFESPYKIDSALTCEQNFSALIDSNRTEAGNVSGSHPEIVCKFFSNFTDDDIDEVMAKEFLRLCGSTAVPLNTAKIIEPILRKIVIEERERKSQSGGVDLPTDIHPTKRAIEAIFEKDSHALCNYAHSVQHQLRDYVTAERMYRRVIELGPLVIPCKRLEFWNPDPGETEPPPFELKVEDLDRFYEQEALPLWEKAPPDIFGPGIQKPPLLREEVGRLIESVLGAGNSSGGASWDDWDSASALGIMRDAAIGAVDALPPPRADSCGASVDALARLAALRCE
jgi:hypothetical protein